MTTRTWRMVAVGVVTAASALTLAGAASGQTGRERGTASEELAARVNTKLEEVLKGQEQILARLDEVMEELRIVKIRATRGGRN